MKLYFFMGVFFLISCSCVHLQSKVVASGLYDAIVLYEPRKDSFQNLLEEIKSYGFVKTGGSINIAVEEIRYEYKDLRLSIEIPLNSFEIYIEIENKDNGHIFCISELSDENYNSSVEKWVEPYYFSFGEKNTRSIDGTNERNEYLKKFIKPD